MTMTAVAKGTDYYHHASQATRQSEQQGHPHAVANMVSTRLSIVVDVVYNYYVLYNNFTCPCLFCML